mmetsp:Transcript_29864/g.69736  ORF Transcript_29864/g.69736 Transcript_29864/m.69736 type:complete len:292 (+) Transcript_29864:37-912(+)
MHAHQELISASQSRNNVKKDQINQSLTHSKSPGLPPSQKSLTRPRGPDRWVTGQSSRHTQVASRRGPRCNVPLRRCPPETANGRRHHSAQQGLSRGTGAVRGPPRTLFGLQGVAKESRRLVPHAHLRNAPSEGVEPRPGGGHDASVGEQLKGRGGGRRSRPLLLTHCLPLDKLRLERSNGLCVCGVCGGELERLGLSHLGAGGCSLIGRRSLHCGSTRDTLERLSVESLDSLLCLRNLSSNLLGVLGGSAEGVPRPSLCLLLSSLKLLAKLPHLGLKLRLHPGLCRSRVCL